VSADLHIARLSLSWGKLSEHETYIENIRAAAKDVVRQIHVIVDLPGPRLKEEGSQSLNAGKPVLTGHDRELITFAKERGVGYISVTFVRSEIDILEAKHRAVNIPIIAKIEREQALANIEEVTRGC